MSFSTHSYPSVHIMLMRRTWCTAVDGGRMWEHRTMLQIVGIKNRPSWLLGLLSDLRTCFHYKMVCRCDRCIVFEEVVKDAKPFLMPEPMMEGVLRIFDVLHSWGYKWKSATAVQNHDGSNTTSWIVYKDYSGQR